MLLSGTPYLVRDINPTPLSSNPSQMVAIASTTYSSADDGVHGRELWKSDGTIAGTTLVKDIYPGGTISYGYYGSYYFPYSSNPNNLTNVNGTLFFTATDSTHGAELWKTDGTAAGTVMVADINPGSASSNPGWLTNVNGMLFFAADDGVHGVELWALPPATKTSAAATPAISGFATPSTAGSVGGTAASSIGVAVAAAEDGADEVPPAVALEWTASSRLPALPPTPTALTPVDVPRLDQLFAAGLDDGTSFLLPRSRHHLWSFDDEDVTDAVL